MDESLRWVGAVGLPFMSLSFGFAIGVLLTSAEGDRRGLRLAGFSLLVMLLCAIQIVSNLVIEPVWLQYALLSGIPIIVGVALLVRPRWSRKEDQ